MKTKLNTDRSTGTVTFTVTLPATQPLDHLAAQWLAGDPSDLLATFRYETTEKGSFLYYNATDLLPLKGILRGKHITEGFARNLLLTACDAIELCTNNHVNPKGLLFAPRHVLIAPDTKLASFILITSLIIDKSGRDSLGQLINALIKAVPSHARALAPLRDYAFASPAPSPDKMRQFIWQAFSDSATSSSAAAPATKLQLPAATKPQQPSPTPDDATVIPAGDATILKLPQEKEPTPVSAPAPERTAFTVTRIRDGRMAIARMRQAVIGRSATCDIHMGGNSDVSRKHAQIDVLPDGTFQISDLGSTNGTFVGGRRLSEGAKATLQSRDKFALSKDVFVIETLQQKGSSPAKNWRA
ncbi:FHA domain-containing protein [Winkia neuii]|uniref:FHA domain-containing protein n=1 Tax=Winkia neuii TaxID=33007 RepID=UPI002542F70E|nr:FHA domain-containing protein [Winkia neuii]WIK90676.1 FHA domain-containing protein [Winkia neuii]